jgi:uncharacterized protein YgiM (DUF1202 family)
MAFLAPIAPYVMAAGAAVSGLSSYNNAMYQSQVATQNAELLKQNAEREAFAATQDMQDQDFDARAEIADLISNMNASGLTSTTGSMMFRRAGAESLALRDRERLSQKKDIQLENTKRQEGTMRAEAKAMKKAGKLGLLKTFLDIPTSFLSGASMVNEFNKGRLTLSDPSYVR